MVVWFSACTTGPVSDADQVLGDGAGNRSLLRSDGTYQALPRGAPGGASGRASGMSSASPYPGGSGHPSFSGSPGSYRAGGGGNMQGFPHASRGSSPPRGRSEEHTSELQSLMRISYAVFCLKKKIYFHN